MGGIDNGCKIRNKKFPDLEKREILIGNDSSKYHTTTLAEYGHGKDMPKVSVQGAQVGKRNSFSFYLWREVFMVPFHQCITTSSGEEKAVVQWKVNVKAVYMWRAAKYMCVTSLRAIPFES